MKYQKKEVINPERFCALESCKQPFTANRQEKVFHSHKCAEKQWHLDHPRIYFHGSPSWKAERSKPAKNPHRDTVERWMKYMVKNPIYSEMVLRGRSIEYVSRSMVWS